MNENEHPIKLIIEAHTASVLSGNIPFPEGPCPKCHKTHGFFKIHEYRKRSFRYIVSSFVHKCISFLVRFKCSICNSTFTDYPSFAIPHKHYVIDDIERLSQIYTQKQSATYRNTVNHENMPIGYHSEDNTIDERQLSHSSLWRWISFFGKMNQHLSNTLDLIRQKAPETHIFRENMLYPLPTHKYRSQHRKIILQTAQLLILTRESFESFFGKSSFPRFATANAWS